MRTFPKPWKKPLREQKPSFGEKKLSLGRIPENGIGEAGEIAQQAPEDLVSNPTMRDDPVDHSSPEGMRKDDGLPDQEDTKKKKGMYSQF
jgi:hypothetical protein